MTVRCVDPKAAKALMDEGWLYLDVRTEDEFDAGHPQGAINVPLTSPYFLEVMLGNFELDAKLVVGCLMGGRSAHACAVLEQHGFQHLVDQTGGWGGRDSCAGWLAEELPVGGGVRYTDVLNRE